MADRNGTVPGTCGGLVIADNAITTPKIEDGSVTFEKLSSEVKEDITGWLSDDMEWTEAQKARARLNIGAISSTGSAIEDFTARNITATEDVNAQGDIVVGESGNAKVTIEGSTGDITTEGTVEAVDGIYVNRNDTACPALYVNNSNNKVLVIDRGGSNNLRVGNSDSSTGLTLELLSKDGKVALNGDSNKIVLSSKDLSNLLTLLGTLMSKTFTMTWNSTTKEYEFTAS